jgi:hypothetical protein
MTGFDDPAFFGERWAPDQFIYTRDAPEARFGEDFLWVLLATKANG